jgi:hypothetical protein
MTGNAAVAIAIRNVSFKMVGGIYVEKYFRLAQQVVMDGKPGKTLKESVAAMVEEFQGMGIDEPTLLKKLEIESRDKINKKTLMRAYGIFNALEAGDITKAQWLSNVDENDTGKVSLEESAGPGPEAEPPGGDKITAQTLQDIKAIVKKKPKLQNALNDLLIKNGATREEDLSLDGGVAVLDGLKEAGKK